MRTSEPHAGTTAARAPRTSTRSPPSPQPLPRRRAAPGERLGHLGPGPRALPVLRAAVGADEEPGR
ncbi:hypothetical protein ACIA6T_25970 [Streptomyces sp. NPDC051740]|uniref:hypothetical protein n=1 Tax=Streptomyces sp. NPDC051740 TaxID=3365673 RepID=UPI0037A0DAC5